MEFEDILEQTGGYGKFQRKLTILFLVPTYCVVPWFWLNKIFMLSVPEHWCHAPELDYFNLSNEEKRNLISPPNDPSCSMYNVNYTDLLAKGFLKVPNNTDIIPCVTGWQYDTENYEHTSATKWNMVCKYDYLPSLILTLYNVGTLIGTPIYGFLSDKFGRKVVFLSLAALIVVTEIASSLVNNLIVFAALRLINGTALPSMFTLPYILIMELVVPNMRVNINGIINTCWTLGLSVLPMIAYLSRDWTILCYVNAGAGLLILCNLRFILESPSWLISQGKLEDALEIMMRIAKENGKEQNRTELLSQLQKLREKGEKKKETEENSSRHIIHRYPRLRRNFFILAFCWATFNVTYSGVTYNMVNLNGNEFVNYVLIGIVEFPGNVVYWYSMNKFGRRWTATSGFFLTAITCLLPIIGFKNSGIVSSMIGKFLIAGVIMVTDQQAMELFPTVCRSFGLGAGKTISAVIGLTVPFIAYLDMYGKSIPFLIISFTCFIACAMTSFLPETLDAYLPQTILDAEVFGKDQKYFSWIRQSSTAKSKQVSVSTVEEGKIEVSKQDK